MLLGFLVLHMFQCDSITAMGNSQISAIPEITANHPDALLVHEAAIERLQETKY